MNISAIAGIIAFLTGTIYTIKAYTLPDATIGNPIAPKIFPLALGIIMILLGLSLTIQEIKKGGLKINKKEGSEKDDTNKLIFYTCGACILYALLFNRIGYVLSTIVFLEIILLLFNSKDKWKINTIVAVSFSVFIYVVFSKLLGITLPVMPFIYI